jgi:DNA replicative helicase MCM subunit Mcm2 (Cdc46/Mcm family)
MNEDPNAARCPNNPYVIVPDKSIYVDQQTMKLQEAPEIIPTGEMPRNISIIIDRELVGRAVPGTRVVVTGVSQIYQSASAKSMGDASVRFVRKSNKTQKPFLVFLASADVGFHCSAILI